jgi:outer membrane protein
MRVVLTTLCLAGVVAVAYAQGSAPPVKIAFINGDQIMRSAPGRAEAQAQLDREVEVFRAEVKRMGDSLDAMVKAYQSIEATLSPSVRDARRKAIEEQQSRFELRNDSLNSRANRRQAELFQPVLDLVNKVLQDIRNEDGYAFIYNISQTPGVPQPIVAWDKNLDITERVIGRVMRQPAPAVGRAGTPPPRGRGDTVGRTPQLRLPQR